MKNTALFAALTLSVALGARAADKKAPEKKAAAMTSEQMDTQAKMEKAMAAGKPSAGHARLKDVAGKFNAKTKMWMAPGAKVEESKGIATFEWILDGRFLRQKFLGDWGGKKFEGQGHIGYDNVRKQYVNTWMDSMSTGLMYSTGNYDEGSKTIRDEGTFSCPITGDPSKWFRSEWTIPGGDTHTYAMFGRDSTGKEYKTMEIVYTRAK